MTGKSIRLAMGALLVSLVAAACGGAPAATAGPGASNVPTALPGASVTLPSIIPDQPLEDLFPDEIGGQPLQVESATGQSILTLFGNDDPGSFTEFLAGLGTTIDQLSAAMGILFIAPASEGGDMTGVTLLGLRVRNVAAPTVVEHFAALVQREQENAQITQQTIAGKPVTAVVDPESPEGAVYLYPSGDVTFIVGGTPNLVEEAFSKLR